MHFNSREPTYTFSECNGDGGECSDDEYVFSCTFSDSLMKMCLKKKEEEEKKKRMEEKKKKEEEERKKEEKRKEEERKKEEAIKERKKKLNAIKTDFTTRVNELQQKTDTLEQDVTKRLSSLSTHLTALSKQCTEATHSAEKKKDELIQMLMTKKQQFRRNLRIRESERYCCVNGSLQLFELMKPSPMKLRCLSTWREKRAKMEEAVSLAVDCSHKQCNIRVCFGHSNTTSELEFSRFFSHFAFPPSSKISLQLVSSPRDADLFVRLHVIRSAQQTSSYEEEGSEGSHRIECVVCPTWLASSLQTKNVVILDSVDEVKPFVSKWREMVEKVVMEKEASDAGIPMNEWMWNVVSRYLDWRWNCVDEEEFVKEVFHGVKKAMLELGMRREVRAVEEAEKKVRSLEDVRLLTGSLWNAKISSERIQEVEKRLAKVDVTSLKKEQQRQEEVSIKSIPSALELAMQKEMELSNALEQTMMEKATEPDLASLLDSFEIDENSVLY